MALEKVINNGFGAYKSGENSVKPSYGVERIPFDGLTRLIDETGDGGVSVFALNDGDPRIRFVGGGWAIDTAGVGGGAEGAIARGSTVGDYVEITFFGTNLNLLVFMNAPGGTAPDWRVSSDGGTTFGSNVFIATSDALNGRRLKSNVVLPVFSSATVGTHTIRIRNASASNAGLTLFGCEVINTKAANNTTLTDISNGDIFSDGYRYRFTDTTPARPPVIPTAYSGSRGARVISYINPLTQIFEQAIENVDAAQANLTSTNHTNEEIVRKVNFREFGANSQFNPGGGFTNRAFTLSDGTTTLSSTGSTTSANSTAVYLALANQFIDFTFVGTGFDIVRDDGITSTGNNQTLSVFVDGVDVGNLATVVNSVASPTVVPIVSGLPYGTHVVRILLDANVANFHIGFSDFIIYGPKKPTIPGSAVEIADYNIMADYSATTSGNTNSYSTGVINKVATREIIYTGTATLGTGAAAINGQFVSLDAGSGDYSISYTFYGTGFEASCTNSSSTTNPRPLEVFVDNTQLADRFTTVTVPASRYTGSTTSQWETEPTTTTGSPSTRIQVSGMPLGFTQLDLRE